MFLAYGVFFKKDGEGHSQKIVCNTIDEARDHIDSIVGHNNADIFRIEELIPGIAPVVREIYSKPAPTCLKDLVKSPPYN